MVQPKPVTHFTLFPTPIGACAIVWNQRGILSLQLPEGTEAALRARVHDRFQEANESHPDRRISTAIHAVVSLLEGESTDLSALELDMHDVPPFHRRVYELARTIPFGATLSYGELAARLGCPKAARAVGQALGRNPFALIVPCHRVLAATGKLTGFSAYGGLVTKRRLLELERSDRTLATAVGRRSRKSDSPRLVG